MYLTNGRLTIDNAPAERAPNPDLSDLLPDRWHPSHTSTPAARIAG